jgi:hypothetical protein
MFRPFWLRFERKPRFVPPGLFSRPLPFHRTTLDRCRGRPFRNPALDPPDQLGGLFLAQHTADCVGGHKRRGGLVEPVTFTELRTLIDAHHGREQTGLNDIRGIQDDGAK